VIAAGAHFGQGYLLARPAFPLPPVVWPAELDDEEPTGPLSTPLRKRNSTMRPRTQTKTKTRR